MFVNKRADDQLSVQYLYYELCSSVISWVMLVGSPEEEKEEDDEHDGSNEDMFKPEIVCVHSHSRDDTTDTCARCFSEPLQNITHNHNHMHINSSRTDYDEALSEIERDSLSDDEEEIEKENEKIEGIDSEKYDDLTHDDLNSKLRLIFHLDGLKETGGEYLVDMASWGKLQFKPRHLFFFFLFSGFCHIQSLSGS